MASPIRNNDPEKIYTGDEPLVDLLREAEQAHQTGLMAIQKGDLEKARRHLLHGIKCCLKSPGWNVLEASSQDGVHSRNVFFALSRRWLELLRQ